MIAYQHTKPQPGESTRRLGRRLRLRAVPMLLASVLSAFAAWGDGGTGDRPSRAGVLPADSSSTIARLPKRQNTSVAKDCPVYEALFEAAASTAPVSSEVVAMGRTLADAVTLHLHQYREQYRELGRKQNPPESMPQTPASSPCPDAKSETSRLNAEKLERELQEMEATIPVEERVLGAEAEAARMWQSVRRSLTQVTDDLITAYVRANVDSQKLALQCAGIDQHVIELSDSVYEEILRCGWTPETAARSDRGLGIFRLSRPGFSADGKSALVYLARTWSDFQGEALHLSASSRIRTL